MTTHTKHELIRAGLFFILIVIWVLVFIAFVGSRGSTTESTKENVTVQIVSSHWTGSGFILEGGIIVTAAHVMQDVVDAKAVFSDGTTVCLDPNTYMIDDVWDIACAKLSGYEGPYATLGDTNSITIGTDVEIIGYPFGIELWHSFGEVARLENAGNIDIDCDVNPGNSGGGIFIGSKIVGVITCGYAGTDISSGIAVNVIKNVLNRYEILHGI